MLRAFNFWFHLKERVKLWPRTILKPGVDAVASIPLVFLAVSMVLLLQVPAHFMLRAGWISAGVLSNELIAVAGVPLFLIWRLRLNGRRLLPLRKPDAQAVLLVIIVTYGACLVIDYFTVASEWVWPLPDHIRGALNRLMAVSAPWELWWKLILLCVVPAVCEELFFRGFCQTSLAARWGPVPALLVTSFMFAILHGNPWYVHLYFLLGLLLGWVYMATGMLWAPIVCHLVNNAWTFLNHARGFSLPFEHPVGLMDFVLFAAGVFIFISSAALLRRLPMRETGSQ